MRSEIQKFAEEVSSRVEFIESTQDALAGSIEFQTLAHAYAEAPKTLRPQSLRQLADFAVLFVIGQESKNTKGEI